MTCEKVKTIALVILGLAVFFLTVGLWDPFDIRKPKVDPKDPTPEFEKERETEKAKTNAAIYKDVAELGSASPGDDRDNALSDMLDEDYPGTK